MQKVTRREFIIGGPGLISSFIALDAFGYTPFRPPGSRKYVSGWYKEELPHLYVSRGIGTTGVPIRLGSGAEVAMLHLKTQIEA